LLQQKANVAFKAAVILSWYCFAQKTKDFGCDGKLGIPAPVQGHLAYSGARRNGLHAHGMVSALHEFIERCLNERSMNKLTAGPSPLTR
jgi:hypothetical protein